MEGSEDNSNGTAIPKKARSLDLKSLYKSNLTEETPKKNFKRIGSSPADGDEKRNKKKKARKEVSLSRLENVDCGSKKVLNEECHEGPNSVKQDLDELKSGAGQRLSSNSGLNRVSFGVSGDVVHIPKRKRNFVGRRKIDVGQTSNLAGQSNCNLSHVNQVPKLSSDDLGRVVESSKVKQKNNFYEFKENKNSDSNSVQHLKENGDCASHSVVNSGDSSLKKSQRKDKKRKALASDRISVAREAEPLNASCKISDGLPEDDEENLEENAARMLSSRFDPSCTGFSSSSKSSTLPSANGLSFLLSSGQSIVNRRPKSRSGSESASVDTAGRILRPRKQFKDKGNSRKRRHFYEIHLDDVDVHWVLNRRIKIFWPLDQSWYYGLVDDYDEEQRIHHIKYDDRDVEWINLRTERFKLLLHRSEVPGNAKGERALSKSKSSDHQNGSKSRKDRQGREVIKEDNSCGGSSMDSEPIISWLARSSHRLKSAPFNGIKKQKTSMMLPSSTSPLLYDEPVTTKGDLSMGSLRGVKNDLSRDSLSQDKLGDDFRDKSSLQTATCTRDGKKPIVYSRRRFRHKPEQKQIVASVPCSVSFDHVVGGVEIVKEQSDRRVEVWGPLWFTYNEGVSNFFWDMKSASIKFDLKFPMRLVLDDFFYSENLWLLHAVLQLRYGTIMTKWPRVCLEMLFVDNVVGLRFLLFEGCLKMAAALVIFVLRVFHQPAQQGKYVDLQLPFTSIGFKFTSVDVIKKPHLFAFYNFSRVNNSKWVYLDSQLKRHCLLSKQLHLSECTYDNIQRLQNGSNRVPVTSVSEPSSDKVTRKKRPGIIFMGVSKVSSQIDAHQSSDASERKLPPFALSFAAAPTFFLCLHLKLLMEQSVANISFYGHGPTDDRDNSGLVTDDCSSIDDCSNRNSEILPRKDMMMTLSNGAKDVGLSCAELVQVIGPSTCSDQILSQRYLTIGLHGAGTSNSQGSERIGNLHMPEWQTHHSVLGPDSLPSSSSIHQHKAVDGSHSFVGDLSVQIPSVEQHEKTCDGDLHSAQHSPDFSWNINGGILSSNPTSRRSSWFRNRNSSLSFLSPGWSDGKADSLYNDFSSGPKKPRTQVSYSVPFAGYEFNSRNRSHHHRGLPHKRIRKATEKKSSDVARGPEKNFECLSCNANVLITLGDKGWREYGASVVLELFDNNEWRLSVKLLGITKYSYKAHQFLQPGPTNRYTHSMMWKGGKDWILEFPDRSQWALFKEMHEECYNRNIRAASVKNIPIPGVHMIEENDDNGPEVTFVRSCKYFRQIETDVEMALDPSHVLYDMDSEDEQWISNVQKSEKYNSDFNGISEEMFEKTMDMFEKAAYAQQRDQFTPSEIEEFTVNVGPLCVVKIIYDHWQQRRQKKGMALIRHFQPPLWERYLQQVREWEVALAKNSATSSNGSLDKVTTLEKPPMFAFCLKPRGLESLNKGLKHRSQKRISVSGHTNCIPDQDGFHNVGRRLNCFPSGDEKFVYPGYGYDSLDDSPLPQTSPSVFSPRDAGSMRSYSMSNDGYYRSHIPTFHRSKSKRFGSFVHHNDSEMMASYSQRMSASEKRNGVGRWNMGNHDFPGHRQYLFDGSQRHGIEQLDGSDFDEYRLRDASGAAQYALKRAKLKRDRAQRLLYRADVAIHKAVVALMTAEAMKASEDSVGDG